MNKIKLFLSLLALPFLFVFFSNSVLAEGEFNSDFDVTYKVKENGITEVSSRITLTNVFSNLYATSYSLVLDSINPTNIKSFNGLGQVYQTEVKKEGSKTNITVNFPDAVVGKDKSRTFWVNYDESSFAIRTGEVWEISIPRLAEEADFGSYYVNLIVPNSLGQEAYISPTPRSKNTENDNQVYRFNKDDVRSTGITAGFGQFQVFSFNLNYHLENPLAKEAETQITLPPDTAFQKIYYQNINPRPTAMEVDSDGNWIAKYKLKARERVDVVANGHVQIFASLRPFGKPTEDSLNENLGETEFWQTNNSQILALAKSLRTPKAIYDYVSSNLKYDYTRVKANVERLGSVEALNNPNSAICMEFTDLFIALSRAAGIPAREVNGFAYTENPDIQPLSLVNDVLHAWPEYYDSKLGAWIPVDPTWESTTGGVDYFSKLDLRHFTFVIHGKSATKPYAAGSYKLGSNPQKDVFVSFGNLPQERNSKISVSVKLEGWIPLISNKLDVLVSNPGPSAVYNLKPRIFFDDKDIRSSEEIQVLLPFQNYKTYIDIPSSFLGANTPDVVKVEIDGEEALIATNKSQVVIYNLLFIFIAAFAIMLTILIRVKKWKLFSLKKKSK